MVRIRQDPTLKRLMILTVLLVAVVLLYRKRSSIQLDLLSKQTYNRVYYERIYSDVSDEVADWRRRYDNEYARAEEHLKSLTMMQSHAKLLQEENESLKQELLRITGQLEQHEGSRILEEN